MEYKIRDGLPEYIREILQREKISGIVKEFSIERKDDDDILNIGMPESYVLTVFEEAEGLKDMVENGRKTPRYGPRILADPDYFKCCMKYYKTPCFRMSPSEVE